MLKKEDIIHDFFLKFFQQKIQESLHKKNLIRMCIEILKLNLSITIYISKIANISVGEDKLFIFDKCKERTGLFLESDVHRTERCKQFFVRFWGKKYTGIDRSTSFGNGRCTSVQYGGQFKLRAKICQSFCKIT